jgi:DNA-binding MarR family transcriptional regulator
MLSDSSMNRSITRDQLVAQLRGEVRAAQAAVAAVDHAVAQRLGVNATDHRCLDILGQHGPLTAGALADALGLSRTATTAVIDRLEARRYVRRQRNRADRREVLVTLTPLLHRRARQLHGDGADVAAQLQRYSDAELALLHDFVRRDRQLNEQRARRLAARSRPTARARSSASGSVR